MLWFKSCPRCQGDLNREDDLSGGYDAVCLQCGHLAPIDYARRLPGWLDRAPRRRRSAPNGAPAQAA